jgi:hypothetical protein
MAWHCMAMNDDQKRENTACFWVRQIPSFAAEAAAASPKEVTTSHRIASHRIA